MRLKIFPNIDRYGNLDWAFVIMKFESRLSKCQATNMDAKKLLNATKLLSFIIAIYYNN
jgi:hypothetical protein